MFAMLVKPLINRIEHCEQNLNQMRYPETDYNIRWLKFHEGHREDLVEIEMGWNWSMVEEKFKIDGNNTTEVTE